MPIKKASKSSDKSDDLKRKGEEKVPLITSLEPINLQELATRYLNSLNPDQQPRNNEATKNLINFLFGFVALFDVKWEKEEINGHNWVCDKLSSFASASQDAILPFTLFLASNKQFTFNWSYLIEKQEKLWNKLAIFNLFIKAVCQDISEITSQITYGSEWSFIINEFFIVHYDSNTKSFAVSFDFDNLRNIFDVSKDFYRLMVKYSSGSSVSRITNLNRKITLPKSPINEIEDWCNCARSIDKQIKIINDRIKEN